MKFLSKVKFTKNRVFALLVAGAAVLGIAGGIAVAATVATAYAHGGAGLGWGSGASDDGDSLAARIADKLNEALNLDEDITEAQVQTAFNQVTADRQEEKLAARLDELEVADEVRAEILDWFNAYPYADLIKLRAIGLASSDKVSGYLERLVEREKITQAQSDGIQAWYDDRPDLPDGLERSRKGRHGRGGDGAGAGFRRGHHRGGHGGEDILFGGRHDRDGAGQVAGSSL